MACWRTRKKGFERKVPADGGRELEEELLAGVENMHEDFGKKLKFNVIMAS